MNSQKWFVGQLVLVLIGLQGSIQAVNYRGYVVDFSRYSGNEFTDGCCEDEVLIDNVPDYVVDYSCFEGTEFRDPYSSLEKITQWKREEEGPSGFFYSDDYYDFHEKASSDLGCQCQSQFESSFAPEEPLEKVKKQKALPYADPYNNYVIDFSRYRRKEFTDPCMRGSYIIDFSHSCEKEFNDDPSLCLRAEDCDEEDDHFCSEGFEGDYVTKPKFQIYVAPEMDLEIPLLNLADEPMSDHTAVRLE